VISCLCITRGDRPAMLADAISDFCAQTFPDRQLLIVHDSDDKIHQVIEQLVASHSTALIRVEKVPAGLSLSLGMLRNHAIACADGDWVCQWDDDDRYHPERLQLQWDCAQKQGAAVNYLVDQLHWFRQESLLFWDDWSAEAYPMNLIQGSLLARRDVLPRYPDLARGEDTLHTHALIRASANLGFKISRLKDTGWCYIYSYHGNNVWDAEHHQQIAKLKHLPAARLLPKWRLLQEKLAEYHPAILPATPITSVPALQMPVGTQWQTVIPLS